MSYRSTRPGTSPAVVTAVWTVAATVALGLSLWATWPPEGATATAMAGALLAYAAFIALLLHLRHHNQQRLASDAQSRLAEQRLSNFTAASSEWLWEMDRDLRFTWMSPRFQELAGLAPTAVLGHSPAELGDMDEAAIRAHIDDLRAHRSFRHFAYTQRGPDRQLRFYQVSGDPIFDGAGGFAGYRGTGRDITALKRAEERLLDAIEALHDGFILWDADDRVVMVNSAFLRMDEESFAALKPGTRFADIMRARVYAGKIPAAIGREEEYIRERIAHHRNATGEPIVQQLASGQWVRIVERPTRDGGIVAIRSDITDLQRQQMELMRAKEQAEEASRAKTRFLATMSHELRTPLNAIIGFSEVMQTGAFGPLGSPKYVDYATAINASGRHLLTLIGDILDMSRIEAGRYTLHPAPLAVADIVREAFVIVQGQAEERSVRLAEEIAADVPRLNADRLALKQILINLLSNSIKFTDAGGCIMVAGRVLPSGAVAIAVRDTGIGIARERLAHIFDPFSPRSDSSVARGAGGTGLGLSICKRLIELHGGEIAIDSAPGQGTTVTLRFPLERRVDEAATSAAAAQS